MDLSGLSWDAAGLVTVVVQDRHTGEVRMVAHADEEALRATLSKGEAFFFSRSRQRLWKKGETSGHTMAVHEVWVDCDADAVVYLVDPKGPSCHTGRETCFFRRLGEATDEPTCATPTLLRFAQTLETRKSATGDASYTKSLLDAGPARIADKIREEGSELAHALTDEADDRVVGEAADVLYHLTVGLIARGLELRDVEAELARRFGTSGHAEKASRPA